MPFQLKIGEYQNERIKNERPIQIRLVSIEKKKMLKRGDVDFQAMEDEDDVDDERKRWQFGGLGKERGRVAISRSKKQMRAYVRCTGWLAELSRNL